jgi:hypothetical protein
MRRASSTEAIGSLGCAASASIAAISLGGGVRGRRSGYYVMYELTDRVQALPAEFLRFLKTPGATDGNTTGP